MTKDKLLMCGVVLFALCALCVRPAHADGPVYGTGNVGTYQSTQIGTGTFSSYGAALASVTTAFHAGYGGSSTCVTGLVPTISNPGGYATCYPTGSPAGGSLNYGINYVANAFTGCPASSTGPSPYTACTCNTGFVPSLDGVTQTSGLSSGTSCISSANAGVKVAPMYAISLNGSICTSDGVCMTTGPAYSTPAAACAAGSVVYNNSETTCSLVQGVSCVCATTFSDGTPSTITVSPVVQTQACPSGQNTCSIAEETANKDATSASNAGQSAASQCMQNGGTVASCTTSATTATGTQITNNPANAGQGTQIAVQGGGSGSSPTLTLPTDYSRQGEAAAAATTITGNATTNANNIISALTSAPSSDANLQNENAALATDATAQQTEIQTLGNKGQSNEGGVLSWSYSQPVVQDNTCADPVFTMFNGRTVTITGFCAALMKTRAFLYWVLYIFTLYTLFVIVSRNNKEA